MNPEPQPQLTLADLTRKAYRILARELGAADTIRFIGQFTNGSGDYTAERDAHFSERSLDQLIDGIRYPKPANPPMD